ncbi:MAG: ricin-type beta-trefoil lectin domain protein [Gammaproteobacteria bacterium]
MKLKLLVASLFTALALPVTLQAQTLTELKLQSPLEETRGWCVDLFAHLTGGLPIGGFQGHNCFSYMGNGVTEDQGFDLEQINEDGEIRIVYFDRCMTLNEPNAGSFVAAEPCNDGPAQQFAVQADGRIVPEAAPDLCLTMGSDSVPGGGGNPIHLIRKLSFETCSDDAAERQQWEFRTQFEDYDTPIYDRPYD